MVQESVGQHHPDVGDENAAEDIDVKKKIAPFLGNKGEIRLTFEGGKEIRLKISQDGDSFEVL